MPKIRFDGLEIECLEGDNLRRVLLDSKQLADKLYNGISKQIHCRGLGTCGTCAIEINGEVSQTTSIERWRLNFPPHGRKNGVQSDLRLACQCKVHGDLELKKYEGLWGHKKPVK